MKIEIKEWYYDHSCGCCSDWGINLTIDGNELERTFSSSEDAYEYVLRDYLGHEVSYKYEYGDGNVLDTDEG